MKTPTRARTGTTSARKTNTTIEQLHPALPLSKTERGIVRSASRALVSTSVAIRSAVNTIPNNEARTEYWDQFILYGQRNRQAMNGETTTARARTPRAKTAGAA